VVPSFDVAPAPDEKDQIAEPQKVAEFVNKMWGVLKTHKGGSVPVAEPATWGPLRDGGMGTWVFARFTSSTTHPIGSSASGTTTEIPWDDQHLQHRGYELSSDKTIYVRGHLLNDHLGGPSAPYNLVPLTGSETRSSANANKVHEGSIENMAKMAVEELYRNRDKPPMSPSKHELQEVQYRVLGVWGNHNRKTTPFMHKAASEFEAAFKSLKNPAATVEEVRQSIPAAVYAAKWQGEIKDAVDAVVPYGNRAKVKALAALLNMKYNAELWTYEDQHVPLRLQVELKQTTANGDTETARQTIQNELPQEPNTAFVKTNL